MIYTHYNKKKTIPKIYWNRLIPNKMNKGHKICHRIPQKSLHKQRIIQNLLQRKTQTKLHKKTYWYNSVFSNKKNAAHTTPLAQTGTKWCNRNCRKLIVVMTLVTNLLQFMRVKSLRRNFDRNSKNEAIFLTEVLSLDTASVKMQHDSRR